MSFIILIIRLYSWAIIWDINFHLHRPHLHHQNTTLIHIDLHQIAESLHHPHLRSTIITLLDLLIAIIYQTIEIPSISHHSIDQIIITLEIMKIALTMAITDNYTSKIYSLEYKTWVICLQIVTIKNLKLFLAGQLYIILRVPLKNNK